MRIKFINSISTSFFLSQKIVLHHIKKKKIVLHASCMENRRNLPNNYLIYILVACAIQFRAVFIAHSIYKAHCSQIYYKCDFIWKHDIKSSFYCILRLCVKQTLYTSFFPFNLIYSPPKKKKKGRERERKRGFNFYLHSSCIQLFIGK